MKRAAVIGAGLGGLSAAARLSRAGWSVRVFDPQPFAGGKAGSLALGGYRFDTGPSLVTMPRVFASIFEGLGRRLEDCLTLVQLPVVCRYWWPDGSRFAAYADRAAYAAETARVFGEDPRSLDRYLEAGERIYAAAGELFLETPIHEASAWLRPGILARLPGLAGIDPLRSLHDRNASYFRSPALVQLFDRYATYNGSHPWRTPGTMSIIPYVENAWGGFTVREGIVAIPRALERICREEGVELRLGERVQAISAPGGRVAGVDAGGRFWEADAVVADVDPRVVYGELLARPGNPRARRYVRLEPSSSGCVFLWGVRRADPRLGVNNIFFSDDYKREFDDIFRDRRLPGQPTVYVNVTSKETPGDAPAGGENWFVLVNSPPDAGQDWEAEMAGLRARVLAALSRSLDRDVAADIAVEARITPADIARATGSPGGSLYGIASNTPGAAFRRQRNRSTDVRGLYFCGGSAHPGGGMPLVLLSGRMAADLAIARQGEGRRG
jgi:phytoene desaturase